MSNSEGLTLESDQPLRLELSEIRERLSRAESLLSYHPEKDSIPW